MKLFCIVSIVALLAACSANHSPVPAESGAMTDLIGDHVYRVTLYQGNVNIQDTLTITGGRISSAMLAKQGVLPAAFTWHAGNLGMFYDAVDTRPEIGEVAWSWCIGPSAPNFENLTIQWTKPDGSRTAYGLAEDEQGHSIMSVLK